MAFSPTYDSTGIEYYLIKDFKFVSGEVMDVRVAYREFNKGMEKSVLIPTCMGGLINTTLAFQTLPSGAPGCLSTNHTIIAALLSNGESTSPSNAPTFPTTALSYIDVVNAQYLLVTRHLGLTSLYAVIGFSMAGQAAYHWAVMHSSPFSPNPTFVQNAVVICTSAKTSDHNICFLEGPLTALETSIDYNEGQWASVLPQGERPLKGLRAFGRAYAAWTTSMEWFAAEKWRELGFGSLREWMDPTPAKYHAWHPEDVRGLVGMWQRGDVGLCLPSSAPGAGAKDAWKQALKGVGAKVLVMPSRTDQYFRWEASEVECGLLGERGVWAPIETVWGHVAGGGVSKEDKIWMDGRIGEFLREGA